MNAYDIANDLDREGKFPGHVCYGTSPLLVRAANMLRQQADRIAELEKDVDFHLERYMELFNAVNRFPSNKPQQSAKPLTGDEINEIYLKHSNTRWGWQLDFAREIEEKHGIKSRIEGNQRIG